MVCKKCNGIVEEGNRFCTNCGAPMEEIPETEAVTEAVQEEVEAAETEAEVVETEAAEAAEAVEEAPAEANAAVDATSQEPAAPEQAPFVFEPAKKAASGLWKKVVAGVAAVAVVVGVCNIPAVANFFDSIFLSAEAQHRKLLTESLDNGLDDVMGIFDNVTKPMEGGSGSITLTLSDEAIEYLEEMSGGDYSDYLGDVRSVAMTYDVKTKDNLTGANIDCKVQDTEIAAANLMIDTEDKKMYMSLPGLVEGAAEIDLTEYMDMSDLSAMSLENIEKLKISDKLIDEAVNVIKAGLGEIDDVERTKDTLSVGDVSQNCTRYTLEVDEDLLEKMLIAALEEAKDNKTLKKEIVAYLEILEDFSGESLGVSEDDIEEGLEYLIDEIDVPEFEFEYDMYVDSGKNIIGHELKVAGGTIRFVTAQSGKNYAFEYAVIPPYEDDAFSFNGEGTKSRDKFTGEIVMEAGGEKYFVAELTDFYTNIDEQKSSGKMVIRLGDGALGGASSMESMALKQASLDITFNNTANSGKIDIGVNFGGASLGTISLEANNKSKVKLSIPKDTYDIDEYAEMLEDIDPSVILDKLEAAGLSSDFIDMLEGGGSDYYDDDYDYDYGDYGYDYSDYDYDYDDTYSAYDSEW